MDPIGRTELRELNGMAAELCLSVYLPSPSPERLRNRMRTAEQQLELRHCPAPLRQALLEPLAALADDAGFWRSEFSGVVLFRSPSLFRRYRVTFPAPPLTVVASRFRLRPFLPVLAAGAQCYVAAVSGTGTRIYRCTSLGMRQLEAPPCDATPVLLAGAVGHCRRYRQANPHASLLTEELHAEPGGLPAGELYRLSWSIASRHFQQARDQATDEYHRFWHSHLASNDLRSILAAARQGRVKALFVAISGEEAETQEDHPLSTAAIESYLAGGTVYTVAPGEVPGKGSIAAVFRY